MPPVDLIVSIPRDQPEAEAELADLAAQTGGHESPVEELPLDAEQAMSLFCQLTTATLPYFTVWVNRRVERDRGVRVTADGVELRAQNAKEAQKILEFLERRLKDASGS